MWRDAARLSKYSLIDEGTDTYLMALKTRVGPIVPTANRWQVADVGTDGEEEGTSKKYTLAMEVAAVVYPAGTSPCCS